MGKVRATGKTGLWKSYSDRCIEQTFGKGNSNRNYGLKGKVTVMETSGLGKAVGVGTTET